MYGNRPPRRGPRTRGRVGRAARIAFTLLLIALLALPTSVALADTGEATTVSFDTEPQTKIVGESVTVTVTVRDDQGDPVSDVDVLFKVTGANNGNGGTINSNDNGKASFTYSGSNAGEDTVTASVSDAQTGSNSTKVTWELAAEKSIALSPSDATSIVGSLQTMTAIVKDASGDALKDVEVTFTTSGANTGSAKGTTNNNGVATFTYKGMHAGHDTVTATVDDGNVGTVKNVASIQWVQPSIKLEPKTATNALTVTQTMTATVTDDEGHPLKDISVRFQVEGTNTHEVSRLSDSSGKAIYDYSSSKIGIDSVTAYPDTNRNAVLDNDEPVASSSISWDLNPATGLVLSQSSGTEVVGKSHSVTATVRDQFGDTSSNVIIRFSVTGANSTSASRTTNSDGVATFAYTGSKTGKDTLKAYADVNGSNKQETGEPSASVTVNWVSNVPSSLDLTADNDTPTVGSSDTFTATVKNADGNLLPGVTVRFAVSGANSDSGNGATNKDGTVSFSYSGASAGDDTISAYADTNRNGSKDSGEPSDSVKVTWSTASPSPSPSPAPGRFGPADPAPANPSCTFYSETGHNLCGGFRDYWNNYGGLAVYGFPITEEFQENGVTTQYFERARFEWHPGSWPERSDVLLGLVGNTVTTGRSGEAPFQRTSANGNCDYHAPTGHNLCGGFRDYWNNYGGLAVYGMPISEEFAERNPDDGQLYTVQYFERGRFEWHPGAWPERSDVMLGRLGAQVLQSTYGVAK